MNIELKRVYEQPLPEDGLRILIDRLWPRGVSKQGAAVGIWMKNLAPSPELRKWFCHQPELFEEFQLLYIKELETDPVKLELAEQIHKAAEAGKVTLVYAAKDPQYNHANVLSKWLSSFWDEN
ncbi:hypothetical protein PSTEL_23600 [Paenibacillus stellifer]|uniref:Uroporphyrin-III methyltransferase n=1 Tax=Paenibacillus stellifer TaxID=169760 RepID=A0A089LZR9_9BACL|nr:DUF488 family protein [Paenibacillus stellifer]AIQ65650.1 hypothetical protein PSTEL_23600 [Paenibacillus stellifer]